MSVPAMSVVAYKLLRQDSLSAVKPPAAAETVAMARSTGPGVGVAVAVGVVVAIGAGGGSASSHPAESIRPQRAMAISSTRIREVVSRTDSIRLLAFIERLLGCVDILELPVVIPEQVVIPAPYCGTG